MRPTPFELWLCRRGAPATAYRLDGAEQEVITLSKLAHSARRAGRREEADVLRHTLRRAMRRYNAAARAAIEEAKWMVWSAHDRLTEGTLYSTNMD